MTTKESLIDSLASGHEEELTRMLHEADLVLDDLLFNQGITDYNEGLDPVVADLAYMQGYATAEDEDRNYSPPSPDEYLPV
jgi:hypothetical protein